MKTELITKRERVADFVFDFLVKTYGTEPTGTAELCKVAVLEAFSEVYANWDSI